MGSLSKKLAVALLCLHGGLAAAQPSERGTVRFNQVEYVTCANWPRFQALWESGHQQTLRMVILGDSQETSPGGAGYVYVPRLGYEFWMRYGNVPETSFNGAGTYGNNFDAAWLVRSNSGGPNPIVGRVPMKWLPPGIGEMRSHCSTNATTNLTGQSMGQMDTLLAQGEVLPPACQIPPGLTLFDINGTIAAEIFAATNPSSGEVHFRARPQQTVYSNYFAPVTTEGVLDMDLESPVFQIKSAFTAPLDPNGHRYLGVEICGSRDDKLTDILGMRLVNLANPRGVAITPLCAGGYRTSDFLSRHSCAPFFTAMRFNVAMIAYGANDAGNAISPQQFRTDVLALMAWVRQTTGDPHFPFILVSDPDRIYLSSVMRDYYDRYPAVFRAIALQDNDTLAINSRRILDERGWRQGTEMFWTLSSDGVHASPEGARLMAHEVVDAMMTGPAWRPRLRLAPAEPPAP